MVLIRGRVLGNNLNLAGETPDGERAAVKQMTESDMLDQTLIL